VRTIVWSTLTISLAAALLAGCGGSQPPISALGAMPGNHTVAQARGIMHPIRPAPSSYRVLYSFKSLPDGESPLASLIEVNGKLYGTTSQGGAYGGAGTVFSITTGGAEKVLYNFGAVPDGNAPASSLVDVGGTLYGTTEYGGANACGVRGCGTVFSITTSRTEQVLYSFASRPDGDNPYAGLTYVAGTLYGTTRFGGAYGCGDYGNGSGCGTVYSISQSGEEKVLHSFNFGTDGHYPRASLIAVKSTLYGTTPVGPAHHYGTVFSIATSGAESVLHTFKKEKDPRGSWPLAALTDIKGTLYGTTSLGGAYACGTSGGCGTVFSITPSGTAKVLHSFDGTDGDYPEASLVDVKGTFYGTTAFGGTHNRGIVFSITTGGTEKVLHSFAGGSDGANPVASLIDVKGTLYGTTSAGGRTGYGTVFALTP
jgi:uncharacterized repeat protein (TIGR03803 family)